MTASSSIELRQRFGRSPRQIPWVWVITLGYLAVMLFVPTVTLIAKA